MSPAGEWPGASDGAGDREEQAPPFGRVGQAVDRVLAVIEYGAIGFACVLFAGACLLVFIDALVT
jgi:hypothetical protein